MAGLGPELIVLQNEGQFEEVLDPRQRLKRFRRNAEALAGTRGEVQYRQAPALDYLAVRLEPPLAGGKVLQVVKVIPVLYLNNAAREVCGLAVDVLKIGSASC